MILDIVIGGLALIAVLSGLIKGFLKVFAKWASFFAVICAIVFLTAPAASLLAKTGLGDYLADTFEGIFAKKSAFSQIIEQGDKSACAAAMQAGGIPVFLSSQLSGWAAKSLAAENGTLAGVFGLFVAKAILIVGAAIILIILVMIVLKILKTVMKKLHKFKPMRVLDRIFGIILSVAILAVFVMLILGVVSIISGYSFAEPIINYIEESKIVGFLYEHNPLADLFKSL